MVLLTSTTRERAEAFVEKLRALIGTSEFRIPDSDKPLRITISGGLATFPAHGQSTPELFRAADDALYEAKRNGRNRTVVAQNARLDAGTSSGSQRNFLPGSLPGWILNAAYVVHSDEALLATGFIFLFHFFHTPLRPESFPMDPVIFTGSVPLHRFKEERPLEYQRMVATNTLEQHFVPPPSKAQVQVAHVFGFASVAIGVWLAVLIFRALASGAMHLF